jgi:hypothetical protein
VSPPRADASRLDRFRYEYGAEPLHLLATVASLAIALYAILRIFEIPSTAGILLWLGAAIVLHDFIALPLYSLFLRVAEEGADAAIEPRRRALLALNHVRVPLAFSALLLLISFPLVFQIDEPRYRLTLGSELSLDGYLGNWLLITAALFAISGLLYAIRLRGKRSKRPMFARPSRQHPIEPPNRALVFLARGVLAVAALFALWIAALAIYGVVNSFPL